MYASNYFSYRQSLSARIACLFVLFQLCISDSVGGTEKTDKNSALSAAADRTPKNLFPFVWVTFQPSPCGSNNEGVCVQRGKCTKRGGTANGNCQDGFGDCCTFIQKCNDTVTQLDVNQLVTSLETPVPYNAQCTFRFRKEPNICQIRLNFLDVSMVSANEEGVCNTDRLRVSGSITVDNDFTTCGMLTGQHMYLTFGSQDTIEVTPLLKAMSSRYRILATKIPCDSINRAPDYCLQYFTAPNGIVQSFDFGRQQQNNQQYSVCVNPLAQSSGVQWNTCGGVTGNPFDIVSNFAGLGGPCLTDWVQVLGQDKMCWSFVNSTSMWKPYNMIVNFDNEEIPPPLPAFNLGTVNPANCETECMSPAGLGDAIMCECIGTAPMQSCQCTINAGTAIGQVIAPQSPDIDNQGFCLEYTQL